MIDFNTYYIRASKFGVNLDEKKNLLWTWNSQDMDTVKEHKLMHLVKQLI